MLIQRYELRYNGAPHGVSPDTGVKEYSVLGTTTSPRIAERWLKDMDRFSAMEQGVYAIDSSGEAYRCEREQGIGPIGAMTDTGWERLVG